MIFHLAGNEDIVEVYKRILKATGDIHKTLEGSKGIWVKSKRPKGVVIAFFGMSSSAMGIW